MVEPTTELGADTVRANLERVREEIAQATSRSATAAEQGRREVELLAATKYVSSDDLPVLAEAGIRLVGENRAQDLEAKVAAHGDLFEWDFIGALQSRRVRLIVPHVRLIHSVASESALRELARDRGLEQLSMGTSQDYLVAVEEGATIIRIGTRLYHEQPRPGAATD